MAEKARLSRTAAPRSSLCLRQTRARTNALVEACVSSTTRFDRVREDAVLAGNFAKFSQNPTMKYHLLSTGTKNLAEASPFDPVWGIGHRADDSGASDPRRWRGKKMRGKAISSVRDAIRTGEAGLATQASSQQFFTPTMTGGINEISLAPPRPRARACPGPPTQLSICISDALADSSPKVLAVMPGVLPCLTLPEHGPCLCLLYTSPSPRD